MDLKKLKKGLPSRFPKRKLLKKGKKVTVVINPQSPLEKMKMGEGRFFMEVEDERNLFLR